MPLEIAGIYADYGNPSIEAIIALNLFEERFPNADKRRFVVRVDPKQVSGLIGDIRTEFGLPATNIANQKAVKDLSRRIFERTFLVTAALNGLTLTVAVFALLTSLVTLSGHRLPQLAPLWAMGLTRRQLAALELGRALTLALLTGLIAIPVGLMIGWVLLAVVNVEAFGWRLPFLIFPRDWAVLVGFSLVAAMIAAAYPAARLSRIAPADLLRSVSDVR